MHLPACKLLVILPPCLDVVLQPLVLILVLELHLHEEFDDGHHIGGCVVEQEGTLLPVGLQRVPCGPAARSVHAVAGEIDARLIDRCCLAAIHELEQAILLDGLEHVAVYGLASLPHLALGMLLGGCQPLHLLQFLSLVLLALLGIGFVGHHHYILCGPRHVLPWDVAFELLAIGEGEAHMAHVGVIILACLARHSQHYGCHQEQPESDCSHCVFYLFGLTCLYR